MQSVVCEEVVVLLTSWDIDHVNPPILLLLSVVCFTESDEIINDKAQSIDKNDVVNEVIQSLLLIHKDHVPFIEIYVSTTSAHP